MTNGLLYYKTTTGGGIDTNGDAVPVVASWSNPLPCHIVPNGGTLRKYQDGEYVAASYAVYLDLQEFDHTTIKLEDSRGRTLGEFQVLKPDIQYLEFSGRVKILV